MEWVTCWIICCRMPSRPQILSRQPMLVFGRLWRHIAFRLTLEDFYTFGQTGSINKCAFVVIQVRQYLGRRIWIIYRTTNLKILLERSLRRVSTRWFGWFMQVKNHPLSLLHIPWNYIPYLFNQQTIKLRCALTIQVVILETQNCDTLLWKCWGVFL